MDGLPAPSEGGRLLDLGSPAPDPPTLADRFGVEKGERIEFVVRKDRQDIAGDTMALMLGGLIPWAGYAIDALSEGRVLGGGFLTFFVIWTLVSWLVSLVAGTSRPKVVATDRGIRVRISGEPLLIPWGDIVSIDRTIPGVAEYRVRLREGAPALKTLDSPSRLMYGGFGPFDRRIGSTSVWDYGAGKLEALDALLDRHALRTLRASPRSELDTASRVPSGTSPSSPDRPVGRDSPFDPDAP